MARKEAAMADGDISVEFDTVKAWELYTYLNGDVAGVAAALGGCVEERDVVAVAQRFDWPGKLRSVTAASGSILGINRARNAQQALRLQRVLDKVLEKIESGGDAAIEDWTTQVIKGCPVKTGGPLMQIASAIDIAQKLTYRALGDTPEKTAEDAKGARVGSGDLMREMARAVEAASVALKEPPSTVARQLVG